VRLAPAAAKRIDASRRALEKVVAKGTLAVRDQDGFGELANVAILDADVRALQLNLLRSHAIGQGPPLRRDEVRGPRSFSGRTRCLWAPRPSDPRDAPLSLANGRSPVTPPVQQIQERASRGSDGRRSSPWQACSPEKDRGPHLVPPERWPWPIAWLLNRFELQGADVRVGDRDVRKLPEPRLDPYASVPSRRPSRGPDGSRRSASRGRGESHGFPLAGHGDHVVEVEDRPSIERMETGAASRFRDIASRGVKGVKRPPAFGCSPCKSCSSGRRDPGRPRNGMWSAVAVKRGPEIVLFDCGEGTQRQFMQSRLSFMQVSRVFLSHFTGTISSACPGWCRACP